MPRYLLVCTSHLSSSDLSFSALISLMIFSPRMVELTPVGCLRGKTEREAIGESANLSLAFGRNSACFPKVLHNLRESIDTNTSAGWRDRCAARSAVLNWRMPARYPGYS